MVAPATTKSNPSGSRSHASTAARGRGKKSRVRRSSALRASQGGIFVEASIKYVVCLLSVLLILFICSFPELDKAVTSVSISTSRSTRQFDTLIFPSGHWRRLWSRLDFADQSLKNCANILHVNIVEIWEQNDGNNVNVSSPQLPPCFIRSTASVSVK